MRAQWREGLEAGEGGVWLWYRAAPVGVAIPLQQAVEGG